MDLRDAQTLTNLTAAFDSASRSVRRLLGFADQADVEGYPDVAASFRTAAEVIAGHANGHLEYLSTYGDPDTGLDIGDTEDNLTAAISGETERSAVTAPAFIEAARAEGHGEIAEWFESVARGQARVVERLESSRSGLR